MLFKVFSFLKAEPNKKKSFFRYFQQNAVASQQSLMRSLQGKLP